MRTVLGLNGAAGSGKDTIADFLIATLGWDKKLAFANNLKEMIKFIFNLSEDQVATQAGKSTPFESPIEFNSTHLGAIMTWMCRTHATRITFSTLEERNEKYGFLKSLIGKNLYNPRNILQLVGTEVCRTLSENYHVDIVQDQVPSQGQVIITDVRYPNEAESVRSMGGRLIRIVRPDLNKESRLYRHTSETSLDNWDGFDKIILNDEDVPALYRKITEFLEESGLCPTTITQ